MWGMDMSYEITVTGFDVPYGILLTREMIEEKYEESTQHSSDDDEEESSSGESEDSDNSSDDDEDSPYWDYDNEEDGTLMSPGLKRWLLQKCGEEFRAFSICRNLVLITSHDLLKHRDLPAIGYCDFEYGRAERIGYCVDRKNSTDDQDEKYLTIGRKLKLDEQQFLARPGRYSFTQTGRGVIIEIKKRSEKKKSDDAGNADDNMDDEVAPVTIPVAAWRQDDFPHDISIVLGKDDKSKSKIGTNRASLSCFVDLEGFQKLLNATPANGAPFLPDCDYADIEKVLDFFTTRNRKGTDRKPSKSLRIIERAIKSALALLECPPEEPSRKRSRKTEASEVDGSKVVEGSPLWDATFVCGANKKEVTVNRFGLASMNQVLKKILFGSGHITVDPTKPIEWRDFDAEVVRLVFKALLRRCKKRVTVPWKFSASGKHLIDYLCETAESMNFYFETEFRSETELEGTSRLYCDEEYDENDYVRVP